MSIAFTVSGPPVGKQRARVFVDKRTRKVRAATPKQTVQYESAIRSRAAVARALNSWPLDARYELCVAVAYGDNRRRDIDNVLKAVADGCNGVLWNDDSQVHRMTVMRLFEGEPRTEVTVEVLT